MYKAHVTHIIGDSPAISKLMSIKGTNAIYPCRNCKIKSQRGPKGVYYLCMKSPLTLKSHGTNYCYETLPLRTHHDWLRTLKELESTNSNYNDYGIKHRTPLHDLSSIILPFSFCIDTMHLVLENIVSMIWNQLRGIYHDVFKDPSIYGNDIINRDVLRQIEKELIVSFVTS